MSTSNSENFNQPLPSHMSRPLLLDEEISITGYMMALHYFGHLLDGLTETGDLLNIV